LGAQHCQLKAGSKIREIYGHDVIFERHRHRYEVNERFVEQLEQSGLVVSGRSADGQLVEVVELADHPWYVAVQFHPEFTSNPRDGHPLFTSFVAAALAHSGVKPEAEALQATQSPVTQSTVTQSTVTQSTVTQSQVTKAS